MKLLYSLLLGIVVLGVGISLFVLTPNSQDSLTGATVENSQAKSEQQSAPNVETQEEKIEEKPSKQNSQQDTTAQPTQNRFTDSEQEVQSTSRSSRGSSSGGGGAGSSSGSSSSSSSNADESNQQESVNSTNTDTNSTTINETQEIIINDTVIPDNGNDSIENNSLPSWIRVENSLIKFRVDSILPNDTSIKLSAARNEFEVTLLVFKPEQQVTIKNVELNNLYTNSADEFSIEKSIVYDVRYFNVPSPSNIEGDAGLWPDPLVPAVDPFYHEERNVFPVELNPTQTKSMLLDFYVPQNTPAGLYQGNVTITYEIEGVEEKTQVPVSFTVFDFTLPSTSSLKTAFGLGWNDACIAHHGGYQECGGDTGVEKYHILYATEALNHRISLEGVVYAGPTNGDFTHFDSVYGPLLNGQANTILPGAQLTTIRQVTWNDQQKIWWQEHFEEQGWTDKTFDYTCDEPPNGCTWNEIATRAQPVQQAGIKTLVTTDIDLAQEHELLDQIDILTPVINFVHTQWNDVNHRAQYDSFLNMNEKKELWWYQSCMSHGCGNSCGEPSQPGFNVEGYPSYVIDASAIQGRAMEWLTYRYDISGELYFQTTWQLATAWQDQCDFAGVGDGTLFYPGLPSRIGGEHDIALPSLRMKLIREGLEDYEYLHLLEQLGQEEYAKEQAAQLFTNVYSVTDTNMQELYETRLRLAERIAQVQ